MHSVMRRAFEHPFAWPWVMAETREAAKTGTARRDTSEERLTQTIGDICFRRSGELQTSIRVSGALRDIESGSRTFLKGFGENARFRGGLAVVPIGEGPILRPT